MMSYLFVAALLIVGINGQEDCGVCSGDTPVCNYFSGECVAACTSNTDCSEDLLFGSVLPYCDDETGSCQVCRTSDDCDGSNPAFPANATNCLSGEPIVPIKICTSADTSLIPQTCETTAECETGEVCVRYTSDDADAIDFGACVDSEEAGFCTDVSDCDDIEIDSDEGALFFGLGFQCLDLTIPVNISGIDYEVSARQCLPNSQCSMTSQCLEGTYCDTSGGDVLGIDLGICSFPEEGCATTDDCDGDLVCYETEGVCVLPCEANSDCKNDAVRNWACGTPDDDDSIQACAPLGISDVTFLSNPSGGDPTTEAPAGSDVASVLAIFSGMVIMITNYVFM